MKIRKNASEENKLEIISNTRDCVDIEGIREEKEENEVKDNADI